MLKKLSEDTWIDISRIIEIKREIVKSNNYPYPNIVSYIIYYRKQDINTRSKITEEEYGVLVKHIGDQESKLNYREENSNFRPVKPMK